MLEDILKNSRKAIVLGIGGGGDIVGTLPTVNLLETNGTQCILGGLSWERFTIDPDPGPRKLEEARNVSEINDVVWRCNKDSLTRAGARFAEAGMAEVLGEETLLVDISYGPAKVFEGITDAAQKLGADLVVGIDVGGDVLGFGDEKGLMSPLADAIMTAALYRQSFRMPTIMGVFGFGSDGELSKGELERSFGAIARNNGMLGSWGISTKTLKLMEKAIGVIPTEASRGPVEYAKGTFRTTSIRDGRRKVELDISSTVTFYVDPRVVYEKISKPAQAVYECKTIGEANTKLNEAGIRTELDIEMELYENLEGS
ncbi:MAG: DUF1152 domain-containing protein [Candidatus Dadabacteria bacterium]|nr:DUF1152 domain-containing protein [Candidatus Dadabacteria bacterium]MYA48610.1 DUF1152 domain-containing protein [Candidatus Dadabacteria bacterium]MYF48046.1 DUF1152 domain-containing protein [Candidatus Dadabacteria bacterium]MYK50039.1 DUF1152 domain-containing protein [Candidatus Dadabacteria bacterium]